MVVEIGPGKGALTQYLLARAQKLAAIEVDSYLIGYLRQKFRDAIESGKLTLVESDVLKTDLGAWGPAAIAGNLPYYITSPILSRLFATPGWNRAVFLVQWEVARRMTAEPGSRDYGFLSVQCQVHAETRLLFDVPRTAFRPPPKVDSAVVALRPLAKRPDTEGFLQFVSLCFRQKRKTLRNNLLAGYSKEAVDALPEASRRAEQLSVDALRSIYERLIS